MKALRDKATAEREALKRPPLEEEELQLKWGQVVLQPDAKPLSAFGRIKDGAIIHMIRAVSTHDM